MKLLNFKQNRKRCGLTQEQVANRLGISRAAYTNIENGKRECDYDTLLALSDLFGVSIDNLLRYVPYDNNEKSAVFECHDTVLRNFEQMCSELSSETLDRIHTILFELRIIQKNPSIDPVSKQCLFGCIAEMVGRISMYVDVESGKGQTANFLYVKCNDILTEIVKVTSELKTNSSATEDNILMPLYIHPASAGSGTPLSSDSPYNWISVPLNAQSKKSDYLVEVRGDSMEPKFYDGDKLFIKKDTQICEGEIGIFVLNGESYIKKLGNGKLLSINPKYKNILIGENDSFYPLGKVIGKVQE